MAGAAARCLPVPPISLAGPEIHSWWHRPMRRPRASPMNHDRGAGSTCIPWADWSSYRRAVPAVPVIFPCRRHWHFNRRLNPSRRLIERKATLMTMTYSRLKITSLFILCLVATTATTWAGDWPTHLHDNHRSGHTLESLKPPLVQKWMIASDQSSYDIPFTLQLPGELEPGKRTLKIILKVTSK